MHLFGNALSLSKTQQYQQVILESDLKCIVISVHLNLYHPFNDPARFLESAGFGWISLDQTAPRWTQLDNLEIDMNNYGLSGRRFLRLKQIIGDPKANPPIPPIIPVGKSTFWAGVKSGRFPKPVKLGRCTVWRWEDIETFMSAQS